MPTKFTLTINDTASVSVTLVAVPDIASGGTRTDLYHIFVRSVTLMTSLAEGSTYQVVVNHPSASGYTSIKNIIETLGSPAPPVVFSGQANSYDGTYTYYSGANPHAVNELFKLGSMEMKHSDVSLDFLFDLQMSTDGSLTFANVPADSNSNIQYFFEFPADSNVNKSFNIVSLPSTDTAFKGVKGPVLYFGQTYVAPKPTSVTIDQTTYTTGVNLFEDESFVTLGNDFTLYTPNDDVDIPKNNVVGKDVVSIQAPLINLFDLGLSHVKQTVPGTGGGTYAENGWRGVPIQLYGFIPWKSDRGVAIRSITIQSTTHTVSTFTNTASTYNKFTYRGTLYILNISTFNGNTNISLDIRPDQSAPTGTITIDNVMIQPIDAAFETNTIPFILL
jgi:hypothetical protein